jgi:hypothetical protein
MKSKIRYIGVSALARSGKDTFCNIAIEQLKNKGITSKKFPLAYSLKKDCEQFVRDKFGMDVFTEDTTEKTIIRPLFVAYGDVKRQQTQGRCFTELVYEEIKNDPYDVIFIPDIRYAEYEKDEHYWISQELQGKLIHVSAYKMVDGNRVYNTPPNANEARNDPKLKQFADYRVEWEMSKNPNPLTDPILNEQVEVCLNSILFSNG